MHSRKTLLSAGSILLLIGSATPPALAAQLPARSQAAARADTPATGTGGQSDWAKLLRQPVTLDLVDAPIGFALEAIARRAGLTLAYTADILPAGKTVTLHASALPVSDALARVLDGTGVEPNVLRNGHVSVALQPELPLGGVGPATARPQQAVVTGTVTGEGTGEPLRGAEVHILESGLSTVTDAEGRYTLDDVPPGTYTLIASMLGYGEARETVTVAVGTTALVDFALAVTALPLDEMVVTGTMVPTRMRALPYPVSVITAEDIERKGAVRVEDILRSIPGVGVVSNSAEDPRLSYLYVRGANTLSISRSTVKTYIDGIEVANPVYALNQIDPASIERIEFVRGPQASTLHGSEALAGVLQIFTKKGHRGSPGAHVLATLYAGSIESQYKDRLTPVLSSNVSLTGSQDDVSYSLGASYRYTGEWVEDELIDELGLDLNNSTSKDLDLTAGLRYTTSQVTVEASARVHSNSASFPAAKAVAERARDGRWNIPFITKPNGTEGKLYAQTYGLTIDYQNTPWWTHHLAIGQDQTTSDLGRRQPRRTTPADTFLFYLSRNWSRRSIAYSNAAELSFGTAVTTTLQAGFDWSSYSHQDVNTRDATQLAGNLGNESANLTVGNVANHGFFIQAQAALRDRIFLTAGLRADRSSGFGDDFGYAWSPRIGLATVLDLGEWNLKSRASYGTAIRPPGPDQKLGRPAATAVVLPNERLGAEVQSGYDLGVELYRGQSFSAAVTRYDQSADDLVGQVRLTDPGEVPARLQYQNVGRIRNTGWEFEGFASVGALTIRGNYALLSSTVEALSPTYTGRNFVVGARPYWAPRTTAGVSITGAAGRGTITIGMTHKGSWQAIQYLRYYEAILGTDLDRAPYTGNIRDYVADYPSVQRYQLNAAYRIFARASVLLNVNNLFNDDNPSRLDIDLVQGRRIMIGIRVESS